MTADRYSIRRQIHRIKRFDLPDEKVWNRLIKLEERLDASIKKKARRKTGLPPLTYNDDLPITSKKDEIIASIQKNSVIIISGDTGSGKSTQIPKFCLAAGRGINGLIGCTQPRRIAATTVSRRIAEELGEDIGRSVGYKIRFSDRTHPSTYIKIMTDGILLAETHTDPYLTQYDTLIVDEAHERNLNIDFILGILRNLLKRRKDLTLIITSATIDTEKFSKAFNDAPIIEVSGRMYPVEMRYFPGQSEDSDLTHVDLAADAVDLLQKESPYGDILVFMPTEQDIRETCELLEGREYRGITVLPLFARLSAAEQSRVFSRLAGRKIIVSTNVAETSITIPGIKYVVDTGLARISRYSPRTRTTALPVTAISKSSADQRKGRCGRVENGICIRLYPEEDFESRQMFTPPEILRSNLAEVILRMIALNLGDIADFPFIDKPAPKSIKDGFDLLVELGAITWKRTRRNSHGYSLTENGRLMAKIPIDPRLSRMLIQAKEEGCLKEIVIIAAALTLQDPRERPTERQADADAMHKIFEDPESDFITLLNIWNQYHDTLHIEKTTAGLKRFCRKHFLSHKRMREWRDIHAQIWAILKESSAITPSKKHPRAHSKEDEFPPRYLAVHRSILSGFLSNIAQKKEKNVYKATKEREAMIFPGSSLFNRGKQWLMAAEMVETSRLFARCAANITSGWIEDLGRKQCKYTYLNPHWSKNRGEVVATEQVSLYGLIIVPERPVSYGAINPEEAADIFMRDALIPGEIKGSFKFLKHNRTLIEEIQDLESRIRRRDVLVEEDRLYRFYQERLPCIYDVRTLRKKIKTEGFDDFLKLDRKSLLRYDPDKEEIALYPDALFLGKNTFPCDYRFNPGKPDDGVTVKIPLAAASAIPPDTVDWLVPGLLKEKITTLIKGLPKAYRKRLAPISKTADIIVEEMPKSKTALITALSRFVYQRFGIDIPASEWPQSDLPDHLKMRISLMDPTGKEIESGRDRSLLTGNLSITHETDELDTVKQQWERDGISRWDFGDLPESIDVRGEKGIKWVYYPGLEKTDDTVNLRLFRHRDKALDSHKQGVAALFSITLSKDLKFLRKHLTLPLDTKQHAQYFGGQLEIEKRLYHSVILALFCRNIRSRDAFCAHAERVKPEILKAGKEKREGAIAVLNTYHETRETFLKLETVNSGNPQARAFLNTLRSELSNLAPANFLELYDAEKLGDLVRYIKALTIRAQKGVIDFERDQTRADRLHVYVDTLNKLLNGLSPAVSEEKRKAVEDFYWLIEEYKVSLFAQELKTAVPVSKKRFDAKLKEIQRMV